MKSNFIKNILWLGLLACAPAFAFADVNNLSDLINQVRGLINQIIPLLFGIALLGFIWGVIKYIWSGDPKKIADARKYIVFSVVAIAVMLSVWSLALFLKNSFFPNSQAPYNPNTGTVTTPTSSNGPSSGVNSESGTPNECRNVVNGAVCMEGLGVCQNGVCVQPANGQFNNQNQQNSIFHFTN